MTTSCAMCGRGCIPVADWETPTCIACDADIEAVLSRARNGRLPAVEQTPAAVRHRYVPPVVEPPALDLDRPRHTYFGPAAPGVIQALVDELFPLNQVSAA